MSAKHLRNAGICIFLAVTLWIAFQIKSDMSGIGEAPHKLHEMFGVTIPFGGINSRTVLMTWLIMVMLVGSSALVTRRLSETPGRVQMMFEFIYEGFAKICHDTLGEKGPIFMPYITTLFLFIVCSNWIGLIPLPWIEEPTRDLNTTLGLGLISFFVSHTASIRYKGVGRYIADYFEPMVEIKGVKIPNVVFAPLNVIGEFGKLVSHSFRLFGNIMGGSIIMAVISNLTHYWVLPIGLNLFFGLFSGAVQAFVFSMLALTYIAVLVE